MKVGFTSTSLRNCSIEEVVDTAVKCGAESIEWGTDYHILTEDDARLAKKLCDEKGIVIRSLGTYYKIGENDLTEWERLCRLASITGARYMRTWLGKKASAKTRENEYEDLISESFALADIADKYGVVISNECHHDTFNDETAASLRYLSDTKGRIKTYYQSWYREREGDFDKLNKLISFVSDVHISFSELKKFQLLHKKDDNFIPDIINLLKSKLFDGYVFIEFTADNSPANLIKDVLKLKKLVNQ